MTGSPKKHYITERHARKTACNLDLKHTANITAEVTLEPARVTCTRCKKNMEAEKQ